MSKAFATLDDVAAAAGLSRAQVSRALRGHPGVKAATRERVAQVAAQLNYRPNQAARDLAAAHTNLVGVSIGDPNNPFHIHLAQALDRALTEAGFDPVVSLRSAETANTSDADRLLRLRAAGAVFIATAHSSKVIAQIADMLPCVYIGNKRIPGTAAHTLAIDDEQAVRDAIEHLIAIGHRRIAHVAGGQEASARERTRAYRRVMLAAGLEAHVVVGGAHDTESGRRGVDVLMAESPSPTAIFASNDAIAVGVLDRLKGLGRRVPEDISVIGFDDIPSASTSFLSLSTLRQDVEEQAGVAVRALRDAIAGRQMGPTRHVLPAQLILRGSVAPPAPPASIVAAD